MRLDCTFLLISKTIKTEKCENLCLFIYALAAMLSVTACNDDENKSTGTIDRSQEVLNKL